MRYSLTSFVGITTVVALGFAGYGNWLYDEIRVQQKINAEDSLGDFANSWASHLSLQSKGEKCAF